VPKTKLTSNEIETANRAEATALLIRAGYRVYRPEADCYGEDLTLHDPNGKRLAVQLKGRLTINWEKYGNKSLWMLFPSAPFNPADKRDWFLVPHDRLYVLMEKRHGRADSFKKEWHCRNVALKDRPPLNKFVIVPAS
jgi:hypothetical protein